MAAGRDFLSDNSAGAHPEVIAAIARANTGRVPAYGDDPVTAAAVATLRRHFGEDAEIAFVFGGTAANVVSLQTLLKPHHAIVCTEHCHLAVDEAGAPEHVIGCKLLPVPAPGGMLSPDQVLGTLRALGDVHRSQPRVVSLTESTELGTVYTADEIAAISAAAHRNGLFVHMDGARLANAAAHLDVPLRALTRDAGVDVVVFGGTKNGLLGAEAIVVFPPLDAQDLPFVRKQDMQLASKMRFLAAQFEGLMADDLWLRSARHANAMARRLADCIEGVPGVEIVQPVEANAVFVRLTRALCDRLRAQGFAFHEWPAEPGTYRLMCSFATTADEVDALAAAICS